MNCNSNHQDNSIRIPQGLANALAVLIILFLVAVVIGFIYLVIAFVCPAIVDFFAALTSLDAAIIVALVTGFFSIIAIAINSIVKARSAKNAYLREHREKPYFELISLFYDFQSTTARGEEIPPEELLKTFNSFTKELVLWGSPKAIRAWGEWRTASAKGAPDPKDLLFGMEKVMIQLRKDMGQKRGIKVGDILRLTVNDIDDNLPNKH